MGVAASLLLELSLVHARKYILRVYMPVRGV
jgi:hypothetical protein